MPTKLLKLGNKSFEFLKQRTYVPVNVYHGQDEFLRLGPKNIITQELNLHRKFLRLGFPLAKITGSGKIGKEYYYTEESLGQEHFGLIFSGDIRKSEKISDRNFSKFLYICVKFAQAQIKTKSKPGLQGFKKGIHLPQILSEIPKLAAKTKQVFEIITKKLSVLPFVQTHGDFGPFNIYPDGVIDIESFFSAPLGYDLVTAICMNDFFPKQKSFEFHQIFHFTDKQTKQYYEAMDKLFARNHFPKLSSFASEFVLLRCIWTATRMQRWPKIQNWRFKQYEKLLSKYLVDFRGTQILH